VKAEVRREKPRSSQGCGAFWLIGLDSEAQERACWESHDSTAHFDWSKANKAALPNLKPTTKTISLRLPQHLLDSIKIAANARDVPYQSLIKVWLQEKLHSH
jgi:predicted DNA binding CopG/RHH family protein